MSSRSIHEQTKTSLMVSLVVTLTATAGAGGEDGRGIRGERWRPLLAVSRQPDTGWEQLDADTVLQTQWPGIYSDETVFHVATPACYQINGRWYLYTQACPLPANRNYIDGNWDLWCFECDRQIETRSGLADLYIPGASSPAPAEGQKTLSSPLIEEDVSWEEFEAAFPPIRPAAPIVRRGVTPGMFNQVQHPCPLPDPQNPRRVVLYFTGCRPIFTGGVTVLLSHAVSSLSGEPATLPIRAIGSHRELFVDDRLIERLENARLKLHEPVSGGVVLRNDKPWEGPANGPMSVIELDGRLLMYYRGWALTDAADQNGVGCVAESRDGGATWTKPALNLVAKPQWPDNNIVVTIDGEPRFALPCAPWVDTRPGVPVAERIKMIQSEPVSGEKHTAMRDPAGPKRLVFWASADGFTFRKLDPQPEMISDLRNCFDGGNTMFWSEVEQQYVLYYRWYDDEWGRGHRTMARATSKNLMTWTPSVPMTYGDTPREQFYTNNTQPYFRAPQIYIAPAARFMEGRQAITAAQAASIDVKSIGPHMYFKDCSDAVLLTSRSGSTVYDRTFMETFIRPGLGAANWVSRTNYPLTGILPAGPDRIQMFVARHYMQDSWHIERLLLRTDGFASVSAPWAGGEMLTKPFTFDGNTLEINYRTGAPGFVRVEIQDAAGAPIPGFALDDSPEIIGDEIERKVRWKGGSDVGSLAGHPVRLRFVMKDADLFAIRFRE